MKILLLVAFNGWIVMLLLVVLTLIASLVSGVSR